MAAPTKLERHRERAVRRAEAAVLLGEGDRSERLADARAAVEDAADVERIDALTALGTDEGTVHAYRDRYGACGVRRFTPSSGDRVYQLRAETFPAHVNWVYFIASDGANGGATDAAAVLWDAGSGMQSSREDILLGLRVVTALWNEPNAALDRLTDIVISHAHIDHFGGVRDLKVLAPQARLSVHELDARVLENFEERVTVASKNVAVFLRRAGVPDEARRDLEQMYRASKSLFSSLPVDRRLKSGDRVARRFEVIHTAGHCPGHLCMRVGDHLLVGDQVLSPITPHISPQSITPFTGLENYIRSLLRLRVLEGVTRALPAHCDVIDDFGGRIDGLLAHHRAQLDLVADAARTPKNVVQIADAMYGEQGGYHQLLALLEAGAHVEYLNEHGRLRIANLEQVERERDPILLYQSHDPDAHRS